MAAAGLLIDYVMTVAVSIASGVAAITSAYPSMQPATVWIGVGVIVILLAGNLRGVRQAGAVFAVPTYAFIAAIAALVAAGLVHAAGRGFHPVPVRHLAIAQAVTVLLVLRAFAAGSTAMTGIETISNAVPSFKPTEWRNTRITLSPMTGLLIGMFADVLMITRLAGIVPVASQTMLSQLAHLSFGDGPTYIFIQAATAAVLLMAANTSYNDFPRVLFLMARDRQAPCSFLRIGDRLTFRNGILLLSVTSAAIYIVFRGNTESLLPLLRGRGLPRVRPVADRHDHALAAPPRPAALAPQPGLQRHRRGAVGHRVRHRGRHQVHRRSLGRHRPHRSDHRDRAAHPSRSTSPPAAGITEGAGCLVSGWSGCMRAERFHCGHLVCSASVTGSRIISRAPIALAICGVAPAPARASGACRASEVSSGCNGSSVCGTAAARTTRSGCEVAAARASS